MKKLNFDHNPWRTIVAVILILIQSIWFWDNATLLYHYHYSDILYVLKYYDWTLVVNMLFCILGVIVAIFVITGKIKVVKGTFANMGLLIFGMMIRNLMII